MHPMAPSDRYQERLSLLFDLIAQINSKMELHKLLLAIMESAKTMTQAEASSLFLLDPQTDELILTVPTGDASDRVTGFRMPKSQGIAGWVATQRQSLLVPDVTVDPRFGGDVPGSGFVTRAIVCVPMQNADGELIGVLQAINPISTNGFFEDDLPLFKRLADQAAISIERERLLREFLDKQRMEEQLALARDIQRHLWPRTIPKFEGYSLIGESRPALEVGGDYYDFIPVDDHRMVLVMGDVSGKGVGAALIMATLRASIRAQFDKHDDVHRAIQSINKTVTHDTRPTEFVTLFLGLLDTRTHKLTYVNAGHNPPYIRLTDGELITLKAGGPVIGIMHPMPYEVKTAELPAGATLVLFTDGVTEAEDAEGEQYGEARFEEFLRTHPETDPKEVHAAIWAELEAFQQGNQADDITLIFLHRDF